MESTALFKNLTGEDRVNVERKNRDPFDVLIWATLIYSANKVFGSADTTEGYMSRWLVIPFPNDFAGREDRNLDARLQAPTEMSGL